MAANDTVTDNNIRIYWDSSINTTNEEKTTIKYEVTYSQIASKDAACTSLKEKAKIIEECVAYIRDPESDEECKDLTKNDLNGDQFVDSTDDTLITSAINELGCPEN